MRAQKAMKQEMAEERFVFDAFVSYTRNDQKWVIKELLQKVEREANVKLCLHQRYGNGFNVGLHNNIIICWSK